MASSLQDGPLCSWIITIGTAYQYSGEFGLDENRAKDTRPGGKVRWSVKSGSFQGCPRINKPVVLNALRKRWSTRPDIRRTIEGEADLDYGGVLHAVAWPWRWPHSSDISHPKLHSSAILRKQRHRREREREQGSAHQSFTQVGIQAEHPKRCGTFLTSILQQHFSYSAQYSVVLHYIIAAERTLNSFLIERRTRIEPWVTHLADFTLVSTQSNCSRAQER